MISVGISGSWLAQSGVDASSVLGPCVDVLDLDDIGTAERGQLDALVLTDNIDSSRLLADHPSLRLIAVPGSGVWDQLDVDAATARGIAVSNVTDYATDSVSELSLALLLAIARHVHLQDSEHRLGLQLAGRTLLVVGLGNIGRRVAQRASALGMNVVAAVRSRPDQLPRGVREVGDIDALLPRADAVSLHIPFRPGDPPVLGSERFDQMRPATLVVNTARGGLIDQDALLSAIETGQVGGAGLDVTDPEPLPDAHPLRARREVLVTGHIGARTAIGMRRAAEGALEAVRDFSAGAPLSIVNPTVLRGAGE